MTTEDILTERERQAAEADERIRTGHHWRDWVYLATGFDAGRQRAMNIAYTNRPIGRGYNTAFGDWMKSRPWASRHDSATRNHLFWIYDHLNDIEAWRETLPAKQRDAWSHPSTVKRAYERALRLREAGAEKQEVLSPMAQLKQANAELQAECDRWKRQAEESGSLFNKTEKGELIGRILAEHFSEAKWAAINRGYHQERKRQKGGHAG